MSPRNKKKRIYLGQRVDTTHSEGLGVQHAWRKLFRANLEHWKAGRFGQVMTDKQLSERMQELFPGRRTLASPVRMRAYWNNLNGSASFYRYLRDEKGRVCIATARGLPHSKWRSENET